MIFLLLIVTTEKKVCFSLKLFDHFLTEYSSDWAEICRVLSQILLGIFQQEIHFAKCSWNFLHSKALLFPDLQNSSVVSSFLFWVHIALISSENTYTSTFICRLYPVKDACSKWKHRKRYKAEKPERSIFEKTSFPVLFAIGLRVITPYSLGVLIWNFYHTFLIVCIELWLRFQPQIRSTKFAMNFLFIIVTNERKFRFCVKLFDHFLTGYSFFWAEICRASSQILLVFFHKISSRNYFWKCSRNLLHSKAFLSPDLRNFALVSAILFWVHIAL